VAWLGVPIILGFVLGAARRIFNLMTMGLYLAGYNL